MTKTIHLNLPPALHEELKAIANELEVPITALLRLLVRWWVKQVKEGLLNPEDLLEGVVVKKSEAKGKASQGGSAATNAKTGREASVEEDEVGRSVSDEVILEKLLEIQQSIEKVKRSLEDRLIDLESQLFDLQEELKKLKARVHKLEDAYEDLVNPVHVEQIPARR